MKHEEYDWIDDPFNDKKNAEDWERARGSKSGLLVLLIVLAIVVIFIAFSIVALASLVPVSS